LTLLRWGAQIPAATLLHSIVMDIDRLVDSAPRHDDIPCVLFSGV
jgi:hypothetical protein